MSETKDTTPSDSVTQPDSVSHSVSIPQLDSVPQSEIESASGSDSSSATEFEPAPTVAVPIKSLWASMTEIKKYATENPLTKLPPVEALCYSRSRDSKISLSRDEQKLYLPSPKLLENPIREYIDLGKGYQDYRNSILLPENKDVPEFAYTNYVAIKLHEEETGRRINADMIGSRRNFVALIEGDARLRIVYFDNQLFVEQESPQELLVDGTQMLGINFKALVTQDEYPAVDSVCKYDVIVRHEFKGPPDLNLLVSCDVGAVETLGDHGLGNNIEIKCKSHEGYIDRVLLQCHLAGRHKLMIGRRLGSSLTKIFQYPIDSESPKHREWDRKLGAICSYIVSNVRKMCAGRGSDAQELLLEMSSAVQIRFADKVTKMPQWFIDHRKILDATAQIGKLKVEQV